MPAQSSGIEPLPEEPHEACFTRRRLGAVSLIALGTAFTNVEADNGRNPLAEHVRAANERFKDVSAAVAEGYAPIPCASGVDGGAMGVHYVNAQYLKDELPDIKRPQAVMYEPGADGRMSLVPSSTSPSRGRRRSRASCSTSTARPTAMASTRSMSCTSGRGSPTRAAPSPT